MIRLLFVLCLMASPLWAVEPDEVLDDAELEARARALSSELRCPVCQNESIDESNAPVAQELRVVLRERLLAGDTDAEVLDYMVVRFGEFVLMRPPATGANIVLWLAAPVLLVLGLGIGISAIRRKPNAAETPLSADEQAKIDRILHR